MLVRNHSVGLLSPRAACALVCAVVAALTLAACSDSEEPKQGPGGITVKLESEPEPPPRTAPKPRAQPYVPLAPLDAESEALVKKLYAEGAEDPSTRVAEIMTIATSTDHPEVLASAIDELEDVGSEEAVQAMAEIFAASENVQVRLRAIEGADYVGGAASKQLFLDALADPDANVREEAAYNLSFVASGEDEARVRAAIEKEADRKVREELEDVLYGIELERRKAAGEAGGGETS